MISRWYQYDVIRPSNLYGWNGANVPAGPIQVSQSVCLSLAGHKPRISLAIASPTDRLESPISFPHPIWKLLHLSSKKYHMLAVSWVFASIASRLFDMGWLKLSYRFVGILKLIMWPYDAVWRRKIWSSLVRVIRWRLLGANHWWLIVSWNTHGQRQWYLQQNTLK